MTARRGEYNGVNPVTGTEIDNMKNVVHAPKHTGPIPTRTKVETKPLDKVEKVTTAPSCLKPTSSKSSCCSQAMAHHYQTTKAEH